MRHCLDKTLNINIIAQEKSVSIDTLIELEHIHWTSDLAPFSTTIHDFKSMSPRKPHRLACIDIQNRYWGYLHAYMHLSGGVWGLNSYLSVLQLAFPPQNLQLGFLILSLLEHWPLLLLTNMSFSIKKKWNFFSTEVSVSPLPIFRGEPKRSFL